MKAPAWLKRQSLRTKDTERTKAADLTLRQSIYPIILVTSLFFLWGFSYGLLDTLNKHFQNVLEISRARSAGLQAAYFGAYPLASLGHANWILRRYGYKPVFIWGLTLYATGALVAWPCLLYQSFGGFCAAIFIIGNGLGALETAANPYIAVCGPPKFAEFRLNLSQAFNAVGTVVSPVLASYVMFNDVGEDEQALRSVQWIYLGVACFCLFLALVFYFSPIPEITDADMAYQAEGSYSPSADKPLRKQYRLFHAAFAQFTYTGGQIALATYFINFVVDTRPGTTDAAGAQFLAGAQGAFAVGRFAGTLLMKFIKPRWVFLAFMLGCIIFVAPTIGVGGNPGLAFMFMVFFFESICFPTIVALGMRGLGRHTKFGSGFIIAGVAGGAAVPPLLGVASDRFDSTPRGMVVPLVFFIVAASYPFCVNFVPAYRNVADSFHDSKVGIAPVTKDEEAVSDNDVREIKEAGETRNEKV